MKQIPMSIPQPTPPHICSEKDMELVASEPMKRPFQRLRWVEVWRCKVCKEMQVEKVKI